MMELKLRLRKSSQFTWDKLGQALAITLAFAIPLSTSATTLLVGLLLLVWTFSGNQSQKRAFFLHHPLMGWIYPLVLLTFIGVIYSNGDPDAIRGGLMDALRLCFIPILFYFYQPKEVARFARFAFIGAMILTLGLAFLKVYAELPIGTKYPAGAIFKSHIKTSFFMAIAAFFLAQELKLIARYRILVGILIGAMIYYLLFMSVGRIGYISLVICFLVFAWQTYRLKGIIWAFPLAATLLVGAFFTSTMFNERINLLVQDLDFYQQGNRLLETSLGQRLEFGQTSLSLIAKRPFFGWGTGSFGHIYEQNYQGIEKILTDNPHNEYLRIAVELGLVGMGLLLMLFYQQWQLARNLPIEIRQCWQGVFLTFMLGCFLNSWLSDFTEGYFYCVMTAICFANLPLLVRRPQVQAILH